MDIGDIINSVCNHILKQAEHMEEIKEEKSRELEKRKEEKRRELRGFSDEKVIRLYRNREKLGNGARDLVEEEIARRKIRIK